MTHVERYNGYYFANRSSSCVNFSMLGRDFLDHVKSLQVATYVGLEDFVDKLNFIVSVGFLLLCTTVVTVKTYFLSPIECTLMSHVDGTNLKHYVTTVCWTEGTYAIRPEEYHLVEIGSGWDSMQAFRKQYASRLIIYYQWVPFVLGLQCILFYLPRLLWQIVTYNKTGTDLGHLVMQANDAVHADKDKRQRIVDHLVGTIEQLLFLHREYRVGKIAQVRRRFFNIFKVMIPSKRLGTWLVFMYLFVKVLYMANCVTQLFIMQRFLSMHGRSSGHSNYSLSLDFGYQLLSDLRQGREWSNSLVFPRISFCAFTVKGAASVFHQMAQCALPINMINEKIYVFLWFWFVLCTVLNALSMLVWISRMLFLHLRVKFIKRFLKLSSSLSTPAKSDVRKFVNEFLRHDGAFLVRMIALNAGDLICSEVVCGLYLAFEKHHYDVDFRGQSLEPSTRKSASYSIALTLEEGGMAITHRKSDDTEDYDKPKQPSAPDISRFIKEQLGHQ